VTGPIGTTVLTTDRDGVYELANLPGDDYTLRLLDVPDNQFCEDLALKKEYMMKPGLTRMNMVAEWVGSIEGTVKDSTGGPANVLVELRNPDGKIADRNLGADLLASGSFRLDRLPAGGRYLVLINRYGPSAHSPYASEYYPSANRPADARIVEVRGAEHVRNVDFSLTRLAERKLRVRVEWRDHQPVDGASVSVEYERAGQFDDPGAPSESFTTDRTGVAEVRVFGDGRVKVEASIDLPSFSLYRRVVELEGARLPPSMDLVLTFAGGHR
jgi:hypothetical protein